MLIKGVIDEDFINYRKPSMVIMCYSCTFKCDKECGKQVCQNSALANTPNINVCVEDLLQRYINNPITNAVVFGGLEPFDTWEEVYEFIKKIRKQSADDIVIYTGYTEEEIKSILQTLKTEFCNIIVKFGRYIPNQKPHFDEVLGVNLASENQYARRIC